LKTRPFRRLKRGIWAVARTRPRFDDQVAPRQLRVPQHFLQLRHHYILIALGVAALVVVAIHFLG